MFNIGDLIVYSGHGICQVDDICSKTFAGVTRNYYVLQPIENNEQLTINAPVDHNKNVILKLMNKEEAEEILQSFESDGADWIERPQLRAKTYNEILRTGQRRDIAKVANTLIKKKYELEQSGKKLYEQDEKLLQTIQNVLFKEMSIALETTYEVIIDKILHLLNVQTELQK